MQVVDVNGNMFGDGALEVTTSNGKPKVPVINTDITIGVTPIVSGTVGRVLFQGTGNVVQQTASIFWDIAGNKLNLGSLGVQGELVINRSSTGGSVGGVKAEATGAGLHIGGGGYLDSIIMTNGSGIRFNTWSGSGSISIERMRIVASAGNVLINTTTDAGFRLDVNGTARVQGVITGSVNSGSLTLGAASANQVGIALNGYFTGGGAISTSNFNGRSFNTIIGGQNQGLIVNYNSVAQGQTIDNHYFTASGNINLLDGAIDLNGFSFRPTIVSEVGATIKAFSSGLSAGANRWNLFLSGTAKNYIAGNLLIGTTTDVASSKLTVESTTQGFLPPRMTTTQKNAIATPAAGLVVYDTTLNNLSSFNGTVWSTIGGSVAWGSITGTLSLQTDLQSVLDAKVPYTGATANVDLGTHTLSSKDLIVNHSSGSGVAASITKGGSGEALTVVKSSGSGNAASITGGVTLLSELHLSTLLADSYIASASSWNAKQDAITLTTTGTSGPATLVGATLNIPQYGGGGGASIIKLPSQTLLAASWSLSGSYYVYTFSNVNITVNTRVDFTPDNSAYTEVTTCGMLPQVDVAAGTCRFFSLFPPQSDILGEVTIFPTV